jgi:hypothetical protein
MYLVPERPLSARGSRKAPDMYPWMYCMHAFKHARCLNDLPVVVPSSGQPGKARLQTVVLQPAPVQQGLELDVQADTIHRGQHCRPPADSIHRRHLQGSQALPVVGYSPREHSSPQESNLHSHRAGRPAAGPVWPAEWSPRGTTPPCTAGPTGGRQQQCRGERPERPNRGGRRCMATHAHAPVQNAVQQSPPDVPARPCNEHSAEPQQRQGHTCAPAHTAGS